MVLDISRAVTRHARPASLGLVCDLLPEQGELELDAWLRVESAAWGRKHLAGLLAARLPHRLCDFLVTLAGMPADRRAAALSRGERAKLVSALKQLRMPIVGALGFEKAEVTSGGVALDEADSRSMESKRRPGLYLAGEILDLDGPIGGYNFQAAFSTGWLAGAAAARP
jgi:predicted Rossmann fold flavoprotein